MSFFMKIVKFHVASLLIALAILYAPIANDIKFTEFRVPSQPIYPEGDLTLNNSERLFENEIRGPECFATYKNELYFSTHGGLINKLVDGKIIKVLKTGQKCENNWWEEVKCGRPLGITFDKAGNLFIADAYNGIFVTDLSKGKFNGNLEKIVSLDKPISGKKPVLPNSLDISKDGFTIYWSDSSTKHRLHDGFLSLLSDGDGRLLKLDRKTGQNTVLIDNLSFANGVALSKDESYVVVAETGRSRVHKYHLKGNKAGKSEVYLDNLPGYPDNIRLDNNGNIVISLINPFKSGGDILALLGPYPNIRKLIYKSLKIIDLVFIKLNDIYPHYILECIQNWVGHFECVEFFAGKGSKMFIIDNSGKILRVLSGNDGSASHICDIIQYGGYYYLGSPFNSYLGRKKIN